MLLRGCHQSCCTRRPLPCGIAQRKRSQWITIMSVWYGADPGFLAVNLQVTLVINRWGAAVTFHQAHSYFPSQRDHPPCQYQITMLVDRGTQVQVAWSRHYAMVLSRDSNTRHVNCKSVAMAIVTLHHLTTAVPSEIKLLPCQDSSVQQTSFGFFQRRLLR